MTPQIDLDTEFGTLQCLSIDCSGESIVVIFNDQYDDEAPFVRLHSSCLFSEALHVVDCDCAPQLNAALEFIATNGGYIIYLYQEGRGVGIRQKIEAISLQQKKGINTVEAFSVLGHESDCRSFDHAAEALKQLGINRLILDTSNPLKIEAIEKQGIDVVKRTRLPIRSNEKIDSYLAEKTAVLGHHENS